MPRFIPGRLRQSLRRWSHARAIQLGRFGDISDPLFQRISDWISEGDWVIDVGAAVGDYTIRFSSLVGSAGRVLALEPMLEQFELLASNARWAPHHNITCFQIAAGAISDTCKMLVPLGRHGPNWYEAALSDTGDRPVLRMAIDHLPINHRISFMKLDAEGADLEVLKGAERLILRDCPTLLVESHDAELVEWLRERGYNHEIREPTSTNRIFMHLTQVTNRGSA